MPSEEFNKHYYNLNEQKGKNFLYGSLSSYTDPFRNGGFRVLWDHYELLNYPDKTKVKELRNQKYTINSLGYRGNDFLDTPAEILAAGCSQTWGLGVPDEYTWSSILSRNTEKKVDNIGYFGKSVPAIVQMIFYYFKEIGNPKSVFVAFPNFYRFQFPINNFWKSDTDIRSNSLVAETYLSKNEHISQKPKYAKAPYVIEEMMTIDYCIWQSITHIQMLEQYCKSAGILLKYGFWDSTTTLFFNEIANNDFYNNYISLEGEKWTPKYELKQDQYYQEDNNIKNCHNDLKNIDNEYFWNLGLDRYKKNAMPHMGVHRHIHIAEIFERELKNYNSWN